jgi:hypothetical protein
MARLNDMRVALRTDAQLMFALSCAFVLLLAACGKGGESSAGKARSVAAAAQKAGAISMCALMPKEEINAAIGTEYTKAEGSNERSSSSCHYSTESDPTGLSLDITWIEASDYSNPVQHAALQRAGLAGANLGGKLEAGMVPGAAASDGGPLHIPTGPVDGIGDEATQNMLLLTARKGDYTLMVQIAPDLTTLMQDTTAGRKVVEQERNLARAVLSKV